MLARLVRPALFLLVLLLIVAVVIVFQVRRSNAGDDWLVAAGAKPTIAAPSTERIPTVNIAKPTDWGSATPTAAPGLKVSLYAGGFQHPRWLYQLPNGDVLVAESNSPPRPTTGITDVVMGWLLGRAGAGVPSANRITLLRDANGDGRVDMRSVLLTGLASPHGMAFADGRLFVANHDAVVAFPYTLGQTRITAAPEKIVSLPGGGNHWARNLLASPDGRLLYVTVGSASNIGEKGLDREERRAAVWEVSVERKTFRIYAGGLRNPNGIDYEPRSGRLWTVVNERDMLGGDGPPDYLTLVDFGGFYGWPYSYWGGFVDARVEPQRPDLLEYTRRPDYALGAHTAPLGLAFAKGPQLGANLADGAFVALHGSWNRKPLSGYKVIYVPFTNGFPTKDAKPVDILAGFLTEDQRARGRPAGLALDKTGALLVADDVGNRIWRVSR